MVRSLEGKHPLYFEAILQLREPFPDVVTFVEREIASVQIPIAKREKVRNGYDYYVADSNFTKSLGKKLQQQFGGELLITSSLHTKKKGKDIYRITVMFRPTLFRKGEIVAYKGSRYKVVQMSKDILLQETTTGKKVHARYKDMGLIRPVDTTEEI